MREMIDCLLPDFDHEAMTETVEQLNGSKTVRNIFWTEGIASSNSLMAIA